jgi:hypothetical protein
LNACQGVQPLLLVSDFAVGVLAGHVDHIEIDAMA